VDEIHKRTLRIPQLKREQLGRNVVTPQLDEEVVWPELGNRITD
jgi:hypothetical protein